MSRLDGPFLKEAYTLAWRQPPGRPFQIDVAPDELLAVATGSFLGREMIGSVPP